MIVQITIGKLSGMCRYISKIIPYVTLAREQKKEKTPRPKE